MRLLDGYLALDLSDLKGQFCGKLLCDLGMEVIKVEPPDGDPVRRLGPFAHDEPGLERSLRFAYLNAGKQSLTLDLSQPQGRELLLRLVEQADVLLESSAPGEMDRLGLTEAVLRECNPELVRVSVTGFGQYGPYRDYQCPDIVGFAMGGLMYLCGDAALPPVKAPETQAFYYASVYAALGTVASLWHRRNSRRGQTVDVSVQETIASHEQMIRSFAMDGHSITRHGSQHEHNAPGNIFPTKDGYVHLFVNRHHWRRFLELVPDYPKELDEPEWQHNHVRRSRAEWINKFVASFTCQYTKEEFVHLMQEHGIPCLPVNSPAEFVRDEHTQARGALQTVRHPTIGEYAQVSFPALMGGERAPGLPPPLLGEHTREVLTRRLGLGSGEIEMLLAQGVI